ncbi:MAG TPA: hypothetical protein ACHBX0_13745 [Arsenophonus sp.]
MQSGVTELTNMLEQRNIPFGFVSTAPRDLCLANINLLKLSTPIKLIAGNDFTYQTSSRALPNDDDSATS